MFYGGIVDLAAMLIVIFFANWYNYQRSLIQLLLHCLMWKSNTPNKRPIIEAIFFSIGRRIALVSFLSVAMACTLSLVCMVATGQLEIYILFISL